MKIINTSKHKLRDVHVVLMYLRGYDKYQVADFYDLSSEATYKIIIKLMKGLLNLSKVDFKSLQTPENIALVSDYKDYLVKTLIKDDDDGA